MTRLFEAKPFIIAEVGSNWQTFEHCIDSIGQAKALGADAVKFQAFSHEALYGWDDRRIDKLGSLEKHQLPLVCLPKLKHHADAVGIEFMCTAFSPELVAAVDPYVSVHKVASSDLTWPHLLKAVAATGKPVLLSTGASSRGDIQLALDALGDAASRTVLMYCVSAYPARTTNLQVLETLKDWFEVDNRIGFSDHSTDIINAPLMAAKWGVVAIEKHFTAFPELNTPDRQHSLDPGEFKTMVDYIRGHRESGLVSQEEKAMFLRHNRRLVASRDIKSGETLRYGENYGAYRTLEDDSHGLIPFLWNHESHGPEGKPAAREISRGKGVGPGDF